MKKQNVCVIGAILTPILSFYAILLRETVNVPFLDDYGGLLGFLNDWSQLRTLHDKAVAILTAQHNEYKLIFANALCVLQYLLAGHVNFAILAALGNLLVLPLYFVTYLIWKSDSRAIVHRVALFVPVSWILFQLQYYSLLDFPSFSLQCIAVILFVLLTIYLLCTDTQRNFFLSLASLCLAVCSSGNGFFAIPIGCLVLIQFRRPARLIAWLSASAVFLAAYLCKYNFYSTQTRSDHSIVSSLHHISPLYALSFLGASIAKYGNYVPSAILGLGFCGVFVYAIVDKLYLRKPAIFYSMCFILITALAVSGLRSDYGIAQSLVSRYRIYSNLMLVFCYLYCIEKLYRPQARREKRGRIAAVRLTVMLAVGAVLFNVGSDYAGIRLLHARTELTKEGLYRWERGQAPLKSEAGPANEDPVIRRQRLSGQFDPDDSELRQAIRLGIYAPPVYSPGSP